MIPSRRLKVASVALLLSGLVAVPGAWGAPATDEMVSQAVSAFKEAATGKRGEELQALVAELTKDLSLAELTMAQVGAMESGGLTRWLSPEQRETLGARLDEFAKASDANGAWAACVRPMYVARGDRKEMMAARTQRVIEAANHAGIAEAFRAGHGVDVLAFAASSDAESLKAAGAGEKLAQLVTPEIPTSAISPVLSFAQQVGEEDFGVSESTRASLTKASLAMIDRRLGESDVPAREAKYLTNTRKRLTGAAARGELIGHVSPEIKFIWTNAQDTGSGGPGSVADLKGKVVVLDFWATWCGPCIASFPHVREMQARYADSPVQVVGVTSLQGFVMDPKAEDPKARRIDCKDDPAKEKELTGVFAKNMEMTWLVAMSEDDCFNPEYGVRGIPHVAIVDAKGVVRYNGLSPHKPKEIEEKIDELLKELGVPVPAPSEKKEEGKH